jgi:hypothetical protein
MEKRLLDPDINVDGPIPHGIPVDSAYLDDDTDYVDDVSTTALEPVEEAVWVVDTGAGEFVAPVRTTPSI